MLRKSPRLLLVGLLAVAVVGSASCFSLYVERGSNSENDGADESPASGASVSLSNGGLSANANLNTQQMQNRVQQLLDYGAAYQPLGAAFNRFMPQTQQALGKDLSNGYRQLADFASQGTNGLKSQAQSYGDSTFGAYNNMQNSLSSAANRYFLSNGQVLERIREMLSDPEQMCRQLAERTQSTVQSGQQQLQNTMQNTMHSPQSLLPDAFSSATNWFGR